jgi:hypothetical protein
MQYIILESEHFLTLLNQFLVNLFELLEAFFLIILVSLFVNIFICDELAFRNFVKKFTFGGISCRHLLCLHLSLGRVWLLSLDFLVI